MERYVVKRTIREVRLYSVYAHSEEEAIALADEHGDDENAIDTSFPNDEYEATLFDIDDVEQEWCEERAIKA